MSVFISHSFENKPEFDNIVDWLTKEGVPYWDPSTVKPGLSLRDQLRQAVDQCCACIFIATHKSLKSSWCGTELGAFWGAGKPVLVYLADSSLQEEDLPPLVQGDVWERRISRVAERAGELVKEAASLAKRKEDHTPTQVGAMTAEQLEKLIVGAVSLATATAKSGTSNTTPEEIGRAARDAADSFVESMQADQRVTRSAFADWQKKILWVDDRPDNNVYERSAFEALGIKFKLALSTTEALDILAKERFGAIISDMGRKEGPREGYVLLDAIRTSGDQTPFFFYASSNAPKHKRETEEHGGQGCTNNPQELFSMVNRALGANSA